MKVASWICFIMAAILLIATLSCLILDATGYAEKLWNNGIHEKDGGNWVYDSFKIAGGRSWFGYHCDVCGKTLQTKEWHK